MVGRILPHRKRRGVLVDTLELRPLPEVILEQFTAQFEQACHDRRLRLFVLPPRSPKLNGRVERAQRTPTEEF